ncbi:phasin family protein [Micromonospora endophytica]|uniref:Uncharacterized protein n=1 Tax=Micromonospora endophytica TaxID=515350 RepID=A0A2W2CBF0_9ACTN|nr:hypothetical protein [Micromonospora endophytica]PZF96765.1 hypothetical protein C1I93_13285 [Micromonospora endophytica]RIW42343.1 hypothetical protein D3H59_23285 [Micromonospora endophytica]BCJ57079.1 hypothetical protein Jiend_05010 [Micromonospora endophytica]
MQDAWRAYLELAMGLTEAPRKKAQDAVRRVAGSTGATAAQLQTLAEELRSTGAANREALTKLVRFEVERALGAVGLATADEVAELEQRVRELERQVRAGGAEQARPASGRPAEAQSVGTPATAAAAPADVTPHQSERGSHPEDRATPAPVAKKAVAKKAVAKKAVAKKAVAKKAVAKRSPGTLAGPVSGDPE